MIQSGHTLEIIAVSFSEIKYFLEEDDVRDGTLILHKIVSSGHVICLFPMAN